ncbi:MAG TPA: hypothetical protein VFQ44_00550 [Streptosporangiaceae bacterium]|nr:hypothetical protein [Streptosporangiaceae bacterium]
MKRRRKSSGKTPAKKKRKKKLSPAGKAKAVTGATAALRAPSARVLARHQRDIKPRLTFTSSYKGTRTQVQADTQSIYFAQTAVLSLTGAGAPYDLATYYDLRQEVKDSFTYHGAVAETRDWVQDQEYEPPYSDAQTLATKTAIQFTDEPGFSTTAKTQAGKWLESYDVWFRWKVKDKIANVTWTSPEVHHSVVSRYNSGADGPVTAAAHGDGNWVATTLPDRPAHM